MQLCTGRDENEIANKMADLTREGYVEVREDRPLQPGECRPLLEVDSIAMETVFMLEWVALEI